MALAATALPAWAQCKMSALEIPVRIVKSRAIATMTLNGVEIPMLVDSGAFFSFLQESTAEQLKLPMRRLPENFRIYTHTDILKARLTRVQKVEFQGAAFPNVEFIVGGSELSTEFMGILGRNFLSMGDTEYDLAHGVVRIVLPKGDCDKASMAYWSGDAPVIEAPLVRGFGRTDTAAKVKIAINGKPLTALMDTGAPNTSLHLDAAKQAGLEERSMREIGKAGGAGIKRVRSWIGHVTSFELGGEKITENKLRVDDTDSPDHDMLLVLDYFLSHRIYISRLQDKMYATWNGGPVFAQAAAAAAVYDTRYAAVPTAAADDDADALARRAEVALTRGDTAAALADLTRACELAPDHAQHFEARARVHVAMRQRAKALKDLDEALRLLPTLGAAQSQRASLRAGMGDRDGALADLQQLDASLPPSAPLRANMANVYAQFGLAPEALRQWELWMPTHRHDMGLLNVLASRCWLRARLNLDLDKALDDCKDAVDLDGTDGRALHNLAWTYLRRGDASRAVKNFDRSQELRPSPWALYGRGLAYAKQGKADDSRRDLAAARKLNPRIDNDVRRAGFEVAEDAPPPPPAASAPVAMPAPAASSATPDNGG